MKQSRNENNSVTKLIQKIELLFSYEENNYTQRAVEVERLLSFLEKIKGATGPVFFYFLEWRAATAWNLQVDLGIPEGTAYRTIKRLRAMGVVDGVHRISRMARSQVRGGPRPMVWALPDTSAEDVARAVRRHMKAISPKYRTAEEVAQKVIDQYIKTCNQEIGGEEVMLVTREISQFRGRDLVDIHVMACQVLKEKGIRIWR